MPRVGNTDTWTRTHTRSMHLQLCSRCVRGPPLNHTTKTHPLQKAGSKQHIFHITTSSLPSALIPPPSLSVSSVSLSHIYSTLSAWLFHALSIRRSPASSGFNHGYGNLACLSNMKLMPVSLALCEEWKKQLTDDPGNKTLQHLCGSLINMFYVVHSNQESNN